jgi:hypothetical protein
VPLGGPGAFAKHPGEFLHLDHVHASVAARLGEAIRLHELLAVAQGWVEQRRQGAAVQTLQVAGRLFRSGAPLSLMLKLRAKSRVLALEVGDR